MSLNKDSSHYYVNNKAFGIKISGDYSLEGRKYSCLPNGDCLGLTDLGRGAFNYQTSWVWSTLVTRLPETGEVFSLNLMYGLGNPDL